MKENYQKDIAEILAGYELKETAYVNNGLTKDDVKKRKEIYGQNILEEGKKKHPLVIFLEQFKDLLVIILIIAALISMASGNVSEVLGNHSFGSVYHYCTINQHLCVCS